MSACGSMDKMVAISNQTYQAQISVQNTDGSPLDLTNWTNLRMQWRQPGDAEASPTINLVQVQSAIEGLFVASPAQGVIDMQINQATLAAIPNSSGVICCVQDLIGTNPAGVVMGLGFGLAEILLGVTR